MKLSRLPLVVLSVFALHGALLAEDQFQTDLSLAGRWADVSGDEAKFREHFQRPADFSGGLEKFGWSGERNNGFKFEVDGRALYDADYGLNLLLSKKDVGSIRLKADTYRRFYDSTVVDYSAFSPFIYDVNRDLYTDRSVYGIEAVLALPDLPKFTLGYERQGKTGNQNLPWGGWLRQAPPGNDWILWPIPLYRELDYASDRLYFGMEQTVVGFQIRLRQDWERFDGNESHFEPGVYTSGTNVFTRFYDNFLNHTTWTTKLDVTKDIVENKLILDLGYVYQKTDNDNTYDTDAVTPAGAIHYGEHSLNYNNNTHDGTLDRHTGKAGLTWHVSDATTLVGGLKYKYGNADNTAQRNEEGSGATAGDNNTATSEEMWSFKTDTIEQTIAESVRASFSQIPKTRVTVGADFEQSNVDYDWNAAIVTAGLPGESLTGQGDWLWDANTDYQKYTPWLNIRTHPWQFLTINLKYKYKLVIADVHEDADIATLKPGDPEYEPAATVDRFYPGRLEGWRRATHQTKLSMDITPVARLALRPVFEHEFTEYEFTDQLDGSLDTADFTRYGYGISLDFQLARQTVVTLSYMRQNIITETLANSQTSSAGTDPYTGTPNAGYFGALIDRFDGSYDTLSGMLTHTYRKLTLAVNAGMTNGKGNWDTHYYWAGLSADYKINKHFTANAGYTYYRYDEDNNGNINNYFANVLFVGVRAGF